MDFSLISNIAEGAQIAGVGLAIYGARKAYKQWQHDKKVERNNQMCSLIRSLLGDERINKIVLDIDHDRLEKIQGSENEGAVDSLLFNLNHICHSYQMGLVCEDDMPLINYLLKRISNHPKVKEYLDFMENFSKRHGVESPFSALVWYSHDKWGKDIK